MTETQATVVRPSDTPDTVMRWNEPDFVYEPFPMGVIANVFPEDVYARMVASWPSKELFVFKPNLGKKYSLSEINNPQEYERFVRETEVWSRLHAYMKSPRFVDDALGFLADHHIDLGLRQQAVAPVQRVREWLGPVVVERRLPAPRPKFDARFEFSMLPADGGHILPHTDAPGKIITFVFSMVAPGEWDPAHGGGTDMLKPKDVTRTFNQVNEYAGFDDVEKITTFAFNPNQCAIFVKTFNSWHAVEPMTGTGSDAMRKTLTASIIRLR